MGNCLVVRHIVLLVISATVLIVAACARGDLYSGIWVTVDSGGYCVRQVRRPFHRSVLALPCVTVQVTA